MHSMTGYGKGVAENGLKRVTIELKSVNHRFLDLSIKTPRNVSFADEIIRKILKLNIARGHIDVYLQLEAIANEGASIVDKDVVNKYLLAANEISELGVQNNLGVAELLKFDGVLKARLDDKDDEMIVRLIEEAANMAVSSLNIMRFNEGQKLINDLNQKLEGIKVGVDNIEKLTEVCAKDLKDKLEKRIKEALENVAIDEARLLNEVAFYADRVNIDEELTRLKSHLVQYNQIINNKEPIGKRIDFLIQESFREVNTIASKSNDFRITKETLNLKNIIEMMREQVQNLE